MQLKGLVRFFTVLLIIYSLYQLSFTWFVKSHESKLEKSAHAYVNRMYPSATQKFPGNKDSQVVYQEFLDKAFEDRLKRMEDSTKDEILTVGINGKVSYQKAKEEELNLGLDLQGGMNVTLEVEMTGLVTSLANNSKDPNFLKALENANKAKANSGRDFISLFIEAYRKIEPTRPLASLFAGASNSEIDVKSSDSKVESYIRKQAKDAFDRTFRVMQTRIDQFGVAQPNINPDADKGIITVELPGIKDKERVRKYLQSTANLQFWEVYTLADQNFGSGVQRFYDAYNAKYAGIKDSTAAKDSATKAAADSTHKPDSTKNIAGTKPDSNSVGSIKDFKQGADSANKGQNATTNPTNVITKYISFASPTRGENGQPFYPAALGYVQIKDTATVRGFLEEFRNSFPSDVMWAYGIPGKRNNKTDNFVPLYALRTYGLSKAKLEGDAISNANGTYDQYGKVEVTMEMKSFGATIWKKMTEDNVGHPLAIVLDNIVYSAPNVNGPIPNGTSSISGNFTIQEATDLATILKAGKLPAPAKIVQEQEVGPTLGSQAIHGGTMAFLISFVVIFLLMLVYYNTSGWIANIALILNLLFTIGILSGLGATLTAPGIAGLVLTIGMAVDTNVIIYERITEELSRGKGYLPAINEGYKRSLPPVLDAHVTTLLTALILFYFGLGPVKGFATTQIIGILLSLFCGILVSRWVTEWFTNKKRHLEYFTGVSRRVFRHAKYKFIEYRKVAYVISMVVLALGIGAFFNGFDEGVEFSGGRSYTVNFGIKTNEEELRTDLKQILGGESPIIKTIGDNSTLDITTSYKIDETSQATDSVVVNTLYSGLKSRLPKDLTYQAFVSGTGKLGNQNNIGILGSKKVLPTISDDLKTGAINATIFAIVVIFLYILLRFRDWRYSLGTIVALLHDVLVTLAVFSFARKIVPFPLEIDQHFIAAILTVIGFSMNDTVIVFDRIREDSRLMPNAPKEEVINRAINETLSRTIMTSLTVFLTILILFLVGGQVTKGFAFAMLVGVVTGTYSSIFVAAPILVDLGGKRGLGKKASVTDLTKNKPGASSAKS